MLGNVVKFVIACCVLNHILTKVHGKLYLLQNEAAEDFDNVVEKDEDVNKRNVQVETSTLKPTSSISNHKRQSKLGNSKTIGLNHNSAEKVGPNSDYDMVLIRNEEPNRFYWFKKPNEGERDDPGSSDVDFEAVGNLIKDNTGNFGSDKTDKKNWNYNDFKKLHTMKEAEFKEKEHKNDEFRPNQLLDETQKPQRVRISLEMTVSVPDTTEMSDNNDQTADKSKSQGELGQKTDNSCVEGNSLERSTPQHIRVNLESGMRRAGDEGDCQRKIDTLKSELSKIRLVDDKKAYRAKKKSNHKRSIDNETLFIDPHMAIVKVLGKLRGRHKRVPAVTDKIQSIGLVNNQSEFYQANFKPFSKIIELLSNKSTAENFTYIPIIFCC
ncbi:uncharacterized protein LOC126266439 [Aethina tumida]|uniref:uncharacterized protein LOC126266439 n=1 Tax=Aethina tumida TaxID=116153 RepID=UPI002149771F|nr:uncharacterized protein LOC126266439 [Aethina tumida]